jgi:co-chaperonin GroES (HSP10)
MKPTFDNILVHEVAKENTTSSGIILSGDIESGSKPGFVVAVGSDVKNDLLNKQVYLKWGQGMAVTHEGKQAVLISEENVMAIID